MPREAAAPPAEDAAEPAPGAGAGAGAAPADDRPSWLATAAEWQTTPARPAAVEAAATAPASAGYQRPAPAPARIGIGHFIGAETVAPIALVLFVAVMGLGWFLTQGRSNEPPPEVLLANHATIGYTTGEVLRFSVTQDQHGLLKLPDGSQADAWDNVTAIEDWRVISATADGTYTVGVKFEKLSGQLDGVDVGFDAGRAKEAVLVVKPDGRVVSGGTNGSAGGKATNSVPASDQFFSVLPNHDVKAGDSWGTKWTRHNPLGSGSATYSATSTFVHYDTLAQYGQSAVVRTQATLPIDMGMNVRQMLELTGDDTTGVPAGATVAYKGSSNDDITTYVEMASRLPVHMLDVSNFDFDMTFNGMPSSGDLSTLNGKTWHWAGHQSGAMDLLELPKPV